MTKSQDLLSPNKGIMVFGTNLAVLPSPKFYSSGNLLYAPPLLPRTPLAAQASATTARTEASCSAAMDVKR